MNWKRIEMFDGEPEHCEGVGAPTILLREELEDWKQRATALWDIIDNIDTLGDMYHPEITPYFSAVNRETLKRHRFMTSDGYILTPVDDSSKKP